MLEMRNFENRGREKNVVVVDLVKRMSTRIWWRRSASTHRRTDRSKFEIEKLTKLESSSSENSSSCGDDKNSETSVGYLVFKLHDGRALSPIQQSAVTRRGSYMAHVAWA